jgi:plasmid replication initiation protein
MEVILVPKEIKITEKDIVVQHNNLIEAPKGLTLQEYKMFMFLISKIDPLYNDFSVFRITALEFAKAIGVENSTYVYRDLQVVSKRLLERVIKIIKPESNLTIQTHLVSSVYYWHGCGYVDIKISDEMKPYFLGIRRNFTQYKLSQITRLSSVHAIRIYEMLKKQETLGKRTFFIDDLKRNLSIQDNQYKRFSDFRKILETSKREINTKTDLKIDFKFIKTGRKVTAVQFDIKSKNEKTEKQKSINFFNNEKDQKQVREIMRFGYSSKQATNLLDYTDIEDAENAIKAVKSQIKKGKVKNPKAMIRTALKEKWLDNEKLKTTTEIKEEEKIQKSIPRRASFMKIFEYLFRR